MSDLTIKLPEMLTIHHIESLKETLQLEFQSEQKEIKIDTKSLENIDTSGLQLLTLLVRDALVANKTITWQNQNEVLTSSADRVGLSDALQLN